MTDLIEKVRLANGTAIPNRRCSCLKQQELLAHVHHFLGMIRDRTEAALARADGKISIPAEFIRSRKAERFRNPHRIGSVHHGGESAHAVRLQGTGGAEGKSRLRDDRGTKTTNRIDEFR